MNAKASIRALARMHRTPSSLRRYAENSRQDAIYSGSGDDISRSEQNPNP